MKHVILLTLALLGIGSTPVYARTSQLACVAEAVYHEARGARPVDRWLVARTVFNRTRYPHWFASTPCAVVKQHSIVRVKHRAVSVRQFSWSKHFPIHHAEHEAYAEALRIAALVQATPARGCEKDILYFASPKTSVGVKTRVCRAGKMTYRVPSALHHTSHITLVASVKSRGRRHV